MTTVTLTKTESTTEEEFQAEIQSETQDVENCVHLAIEQAKANWGWLVAAGVCTSAVGIAAISAPLISSLAVETAVAIAFIVGGGAWVVGAFKTRTWQAGFTRITIGLVQLAAGLALLFNPFIGLLSLTLLVTSYFAADGILRIVAAFQTRKSLKGWGWVAASGAITLGFSGVIATQMPTAALVLVGTLAGINLLMSGFIQIAYGFAARRLGQAA